ncbi:hypothetical protein KI387_030825 [Taxus chinensis]|uniref:Heat shock protein 70 n=1 Tax=Taxus chinensis TaxID=29808 RepID=A0AA38CHW4_TAXCH|nr:hypothetical protein KI387_030825 [Taxus chinensis]
MRAQSKSKGQKLGLILKAYSCVGGMGSMKRLKLLLTSRETKLLHQWLLSPPPTNSVEMLPSYRFHLIYHNIMFDVKRIIERKFMDASLQLDPKLWPFTVVSVNNEKLMIEVAYKGQKKLFTAEEISSMRKDARDAAKLAGLNVMAIVNEQMAAATAYGFGVGGSRPMGGGVRIIVIFDLGGCTFYVSVMGFKGGKSDVKAVRGDRHLGGKDFNKRMVEHCIKLFKSKYKVDASKSSKTMWRLYSECERAKRILSSATETVIAIDGLFQGFSCSD